SSSDQLAGISATADGNQLLNVERRLNSSKWECGVTGNDGGCQKVDDLFCKPKASTTLFRKEVSAPNPEMANWHEGPSEPLADSTLLSQSPPPNTDTSILTREHRPCPSPSESQSFSLDVLGTASSTPLWDEDSKGFADFQQAAEIPSDLSSIEVAFT
ncbi:hypothetical protein KFY57_26205, partial [Salmonella enterica subsp. enterica serovar Typhimurium]|nr:hypothetical protein [Salmonella enterica subsp. enterica serovar Typhimurium]